jgi:RNA polymerase sigma-70 factor (ECF subfamily)
MHRVEVSSIELMVTTPLTYGQSVVEPTADSEATALTAALAGDHDAFAALTAAYTRELHVHCYRLLGSFHDAEDAVQETLLRAWRHLASFEGRSSFRAWLYRIATNVALTQRRRTPRNISGLPQWLGDAAASSNEPWVSLSPYPDALLDELEASSGDPLAQAELDESVQLAFLAAVQLLPPRQRAVLLLRDVVGFSADAVADMLDSTTASVNSALNRARSTLQHQRALGHLQTSHARPTDEVSESLARRYVEAWLEMDLSRLISLLKRDVVLTMPPLPLRYVGRDAAETFFRSLPQAGPDRFRVLHSRANRQPALAVYRLDPAANVYHGWGIWVLTIDGDAIAQVTAFVDPPLLSRFGFPSTLSGRDTR